MPGFSARIAPALVGYLHPYPLKTREKREGKILVRFFRVFRVQRQRAADVGVTPPKQQSVQRHGMQKDPFYTPTKPLLPCNQAPFAL